MTLYKQLLIFTLLLLGLVFTGIWVEKLQSTRIFLIDQLTSHAQDTATSLGLSLSPVVAEGDLATAETMMNAVFDRGYYRIISLLSTDGEVLTKRVQDVKIAGVPGWFVDLVPLHSPQAESLVMAGWTQAGRLVVESHPGYAYKALWGTAVKNTVYFVVTGLLVMGFGAFGLRIILKPLKLVEQQAESICRRDYILQDKLPKARELRQVVESMNTMTSRVKEMFDEQARVAERLRKNAYSDQLTGLGNRRYMNGQVEALQESDVGSGAGVFLLVQLEDLQGVNERLGFAGGDDLVKKAARVIRQETTRISGVELSRMTGGTFAVFMPEVAVEDASDVAELIMNKLSRFGLHEGEHDSGVACIGGVSYENGPSFSRLLAEADRALHVARDRNANSCHISRMVQADTAEVRGRNWWQQTLTEVLHKRDVILYTQPAFSTSVEHEVVHQEILARIVISADEIVNAATFIPLAERLQMISQLDRIVLEKAMALRIRDAGTGRIAVNVSPSSLADPSFFHWLLDGLASLTVDSPRFSIEFPEYSAVRYLDVLMNFSREVQRLGHAIGLDHFGRSFSNFGYLKSLRPEYVKIDRAFTQELEHVESDSSFFIGTLCSVAHSLDIRVIAKGVERKDQVAMLRELNVDAYQGYLQGKPRQLSQNGQS